MKYRDSTLQRGRKDAALTLYKTDRIAPFRPSDLLKVSQDAMDT